ncbi:MAG: FHA domain-containing protein [Planctomycetota bacterium]|nr:FHA domain-containing protein [Planctomycetota bacterium]
MATEPVGYLLGAGTRPLPLANGDVITFGRDAQNSVIVDDAMASRRHACVDCQEKAVRIRDLGSRNGTFVNDRRLAADELFALRSGDEARIGGKVFYFISTVAGLEPRKAALKHAQQFSQMPTLGWESPFFAGADGKVVKEPTPAAQSPAPSVHETTQTVIGATARTAALSGTLCDGSLPQIIQFIHAGGMTGKLSVAGQRVNGSILFLNGQLYAATAGETNGAEAVFACVLEREGHFAFDRQERAQVQQAEKTITSNTIHIIFECCRRLDEGAARSTEQPQATTG